MIPQSKICQSCIAQTGNRSDALLSHLLRYLPAPRVASLIEGWEATCEKENWLTTLTLERLKKLTG